MKTKFFLDFRLVYVPLIFEVFKLVRDKVCQNFSTCGTLEIELQCELGTEGSHYSLASL